ncbi:MAG TPA: MauE/DoxX family redox-associated membrane protein [Mucilaginibacter sp.]|nr:MauE/DoxX family redox-associated membrane protein [Mucilaginibacter sp.]
MIRKRTVEIISALLILLFVYAAVSKLLDYERFKVQLGKSPLLNSFAAFAAVTVPLGELLISAFLGFNKTRTVGLYLSLFLLVLFTSYLVAILNFSYYIPCSCGGILQGLSWKAHIIFNSGFIAITIIGIILQNKSFNSKIDHRMNHSIISSS